MWKSSQKSWCRWEYGGYAAARFPQCSTLFMQIVNITFWYDKMVEQCHFRGGPAGGLIIKMMKEFFQVIAPSCGRPLAGSAPASWAPSSPEEEKRRRVVFTSATTDGFNEGCFKKCENAIANLLGPSTEEQPARITSPSVKPVRGCSFYPGFIAANQYSFIITTSVKTWIEAQSSLAGMWARVLSPPSRPNIVTSGRKKMAAAKVTSRRLQKPVADGQWGVHLLYTI